MQGWEHPLRYSWNITKSRGLLSSNMGMGWKQSFECIGLNYLLTDQLETLPLPHSIKQYLGSCVQPYQLGKQ